MVEEVEFYLGEAEGRLDRAHGQRLGYQISLGIKNTRMEEWYGSQKRMRGLAIERRDQTRETMGGRRGDISSNSMGEAKVLWAISQQAAPHRTHKQQAASCKQHQQNQNQGQDGKDLVLRRRVC